MEKTLKTKKSNGSTSPQVPNNKMKHINTAIGLALMFLFPLLPPLAPITELGMLLLGVFLGMVYLWSTVDSKWPSILGLILVGLSGYASMSDVIMGSFGNSTVLTSALSMILFGAIEYYGCSIYIARWFMTRPVINGRPYVFISLLMLCSYTLSVLTNAIPALFVTWAIAVEILNTLNIEKKDPIFPIVIMGIFFASCIGQPVLPFKGAALIVVGAYEQMTNTIVSYPHYISFNIIMNMLGIIMFLGFIKFLFKTDVSKLGIIDIEKIKANPLPPMSRRQKTFFWALGIYITLMLIPGFLPATVPGVSLLNRLGVVGVTFLTIVVLCIIHGEDGKPVLGFNEVASKRFSWDVYLLIAAAIYIANAVSSDVTGINEWLVNVLSPLLSGRSEYVFAILLMVVSLVLTNLANNAGMVLIFG